MTETPEPETTTPDEGHPEPPSEEENREAAEQAARRPDPRQPAYDAVFAYIRSLGDQMPPSTVHRNATIWLAVAAALDAANVGRCISSHCVEGDHVLGDLLAEHDPAPEHCGDIKAHPNHKCMRGGVVFRCPGSQPPAPGLREQIAAAINYALLPVMPRAEYRAHAASHATDAVLAVPAIRALAETRDALRVTEGDRDAADEATQQLREELAEARSWARHGYELGQIHCTWTDHGVAPAWLTEGWPIHFPGPDDDPQPPAA